MISALLFVALLAEPVVPGVEASAALGRLHLVPTPDAAPVHAFVRAGGWQGNLDGLPSAVEIRADEWKVALVGCDFAPRPLTAAQATLAAGARSLEASATALIRRPGAVGSSPVATSEAGLRCEFQPFVDPTRPAGGDTPMRLRHGGQSVAGVTVRVEVEGGKSLTLVTNATGVVAVPHEPGRTRVWAIWSKAEVAYSASLSYEVRP